MKVAIDGYNLAMPKGTGIATYGVELVKALQGLGYTVDGVFGVSVPRDEALREAAFFDRLKRPASSKASTDRRTRAWRRLRSFMSPRPRDVPLSGLVYKDGLGGSMPAFDRLVSVGHLFENAIARFAATGSFLRLRIPDPPSVMHWTYPLPISLAGSRNVYTVHDLVPMKLPYTTLDDKILYGRIARRCVESAAQICTVSDASKRDIVDQFGVDPSRVTNTYQTAPIPTVGNDPTADARAIEGIFGLRHRGYFLYFGAIEPKKNVGRLIEAYLALQSLTPLVIVGARAWQAEGELRLIPGGGADGAAGTYHGHRGQTIIRLDYLARELLAQLIRGAKAVVFPSLYEGFGLPVLEAMQLGTPIITSNAGSLPEVAGDAGLLVDPLDVAALRGAMQRLDTNDALGRAMAARGLEQAKLFSIERYQARLTELYRAAMAGR